jgi:CspA family cold shock protein
VVNKDPRNQPDFFEGSLADDVDDTPVMESLQRDIGMANGKVKWFNNAKGYGFVVEDGKSEDLFAHFSAIQMDGYKTLKAGQAVHFDVIQGPKGLHAVNIRTQEAAQALLPDSTLVTTVSA